MRFRLRTIAAAFLCTAVIVGASLPHPGAAADAGKLLRRVKGGTGYQAPGASAPTALFGRMELPDDDFAVTQSDGVAELALPDSSLVTLGSNTRVQVGAFNTTVNGPGSTIAIENGTLRFNIQRPAGGRANYLFTTSTSQIAIRGTIGLISVINGVTTVSCLQCAADSIVVTTNAQTFSVLTGQSLTVGPSGVVTGAIAPQTLTAFNDAGLSTTVGGGTAAAGSSVLLPVLGAAAIAGTVAGISNSSPTSTPLNPELGHPTPSPSPTPVPTPTPTPVPTASPTPVASPTATIPGTVTVTSGKRTTSSASTTAAPAAAPPAATAPQAPEPPKLPGITPRIGR